MEGTVCHIQTTVTFSISLFLFYVYMHVNSFTSDLVGDVLLQSFSLLPYFYIPVSFSICNMSTLGSYFCSNTNLADLGLDS